jgi:uncharacterized membrane protein YfcA
MPTGIDWRPGTRLFGIAVGVVIAVGYIVAPPRDPNEAWAGTAAQVLATLLLALVLDARAFRTEAMRRRDAISAALVLLVAVLAIIVAVVSAAYDTELGAAGGALVVGASVSLTWIVMTDVLHGLVAHARRPVPRREDDGGSRSAD